jgi:hypothetical protein
LFLGHLFIFLDLQTFACFPLADLKTFYFFFMSIIHDALKKVQEKNAKEAQRLPQAEAPRPAAAATPPTTAQRPRENPFTIALLGILIIGILAFGILSNIPKPPHKGIAISAYQIPISKNETPALSPLPATQPVAAKPVEAHAPAEPKPQVDPNDALASIRIEGIMDMGKGKRVALINGNMYEEGQTIYGQPITQVTLDSVTIVDNGKERIFPVKPLKP